MSRLAVFFLVRKGGKSMFIHQKKTNIAAWPPFFWGESILLRTDLDNQIPLLFKYLFGNC